MFNVSWGPQFIGWIFFLRYLDFNIHAKCDHTCPPTAAFVCDLSFNPSTRCLALWHSRSWPSVHFDPQSLAVLLSLVLHPTTSSVRPTSNSVSLVSRAAFSFVHCGCLSYSLLIACTRNVDCHLSIYSIWYECFSFVIRCPKTKVYYYYQIIDIPDSTLIIISAETAQSNFILLKRCFHFEHFGVGPTWLNEHWRLNSFEFL